MSPPCVRFELPGGDVVAAGPGGMVGRLEGAAVYLDHERVSEAHAYVSLRAGRLMLIRLRGAVEVDEKPREEVALEPGQVIRLAVGIELRVVDVQLPDVNTTLEVASTVDRGRVHSPVRMELAAQRATIRDTERRHLELRGRKAEVLFVLGGPNARLPWKELAARVWGRRAGEVELKQNFYPTVREIREELAEAGFWPGLLANQGGVYWVELAEGDHLVLERSGAGSSVDMIG